MRPARLGSGRTVLAERLNVNAPRAQSSKFARPSRRSNRMIPVLFAIDFRSLIHGATIVRQQHGDFSSMPRQLSAINFRLLSHGATSFRPWTDNPSAMPRQPLEHGSGRGFPACSAAGSGPDFTLVFAWIRAEIGPISGSELGLNRGRFWPISGCFRHFRHPPKKAFPAGSRPCGRSPEGRRRRCPGWSPPANAPGGSAPS